jgi:hypothetical protein
MGSLPSFRPIVDLGEWVRAMSAHLYRDNQVAIREMLQNAVDAIRMLPKSERALAHIDVICSSDCRQIAIRDTGIGMSLKEQQENFWRPFGSTKKQMARQERVNKGIVGQFGIGAYAIFKVAQKLTVISKPSSESTATGTYASLGKALSEYRLDETPDISFGQLTDAEVQQWLDPRFRHGTTVVADLRETLQPSELYKWLQEMCEYLPEDVRFQGDRIQQVAKQLTSGAKGGKPLRVKTRSPRGQDSIFIDFRVLWYSESVPIIEISGMEMPDGEKLEARGLLTIAEKSDSNSVRLLKHRFPFMTIRNTHDWVDQHKRKAYDCESLLFSGTLDVPFGVPDLSRESCDETTADQIAQILDGVSYEALRHISEETPSYLVKNDLLFHILWKSTTAERTTAILLKYPLRMFSLPEGERMELGEVLKWQRQQPNRKVVYITPMADSSTRAMASSLSKLDGYHVIELEGEEFWRMHSLRGILEREAGASNLASSQNFVSMVSDEELGNWQGYRAYFSAAVSRVLGEAKQVRFARIEPSSVVLVLPEPGTILYANLNNAEISNLPDSNLYGPSLDSKIRQWAFGIVEAAKIEEALIAQGALAVVGKIQKLSVVEGADSSFVPQKDDNFVLLKNRNEQQYCIRVNHLIQQNLDGVLEQPKGISESMKVILRGRTSGAFVAEQRLAPDWSCEFNWSGTRFDYVIRSRRPDVSVVVCLSFEVSMPLENPAARYRFNGNVAHDFVEQVFHGRGFDGPYHYVVLPVWLGELLDKEIGRGEIVRTLMHSKKLHRKDEPSVGSNGHD